MCKNEAAGLVQRFGGELPERLAASMFGIKADLFLQFAHQGSPWRFARFDLPARLHESLNAPLAYQKRPPVRPNQKRGGYANSSEHFQTNLMTKHQPKAQR